MTCQSKRNLERGFSVVSLLILMPLFATLFALSVAAHLTIRTDAKSRHVCRVAVLQSQSKVALSLMELLALNPRAKLLRREHDIAETALRTAPTPAAKAAALVRLTMVIAKELKLAVQQKALVAKAKSESTLGPFRVSRQVRASLVEDQALYRASAMDLGSRATSEPAAFDLIARPPGALVPDYEPAPNFEESQTMRVRWHLALGPLLPEWTASWLSPHLARLKLNAECGATLRKEKSKWQPVLSAANL